MTPAQFHDWGWRIPFLLSALLIAVGMWVRLKLTESAAFKAALAREPPAAVPFAELMRDHFRPTLAGMFAVVACFALFYLTTAFSLGYGTTALHYSRQTFLEVLLAAIPFMAIGIVISGYWSDRASPGRVLMVGCVLTVVAGALLGPMMGSGSLVLIWLFLAASLVVMGFVYGPLGAWLPSLFPARVGYTGVSIAFSVGGIIGGGLTPSIAQWLAPRYGLASVGVFLGAAGVTSFLALLSLRPRRARGQSVAELGPL
jgi:MFS family permease